MKKYLTWFLVLVMLLSLNVGAMAASDETSGESASTETTEVEDDGLDAFISYGDEGELTDREMTENFDITYFEGGKKEASSVSGFLFTSENPAVNFYFSELSEDTGSFYTIGGEGENLKVEESGADFSEMAVDWMNNIGIKTYDSAIILKDSGSEDSCEPVISAKGWTYMNIESVLLYAEGTSRSAMYSDNVGGSTVPGAGAGGGGNNGVQSPVVVIKNSLIETTGVSTAEIDTAISVGDSGGRARGIQPQGKSITYIYDSAIVSRTWGAYSTDSARQSLELVSYNSMGLSTNGYGAYADTSCHLFLYGSRVVGASDGITASNDGEIYSVASDSELNSTQLREIMGKSGSAEVSAKDYAVDDGIVNAGAIGGGNCAVQFHMPDQGHSGAKNTKKATLYMDGGELFTDESLQPENSAYDERYAGALIVTKSTQANVYLEDVSMNSFNNVLVHTMINSDSNVNNIADGDTAPGSDFIFKDMDVTGDIINDDYQRALRLTLDGTTMTGAIYSNTCEDWNSFCKEELEGEYILNEDVYKTIWGVELTLDNGAVWNVTEVSTLAALNIIDGTVNGIVTENEDGTITVEPADGNGDLVEISVVDIEGENYVVLEELLNLLGIG